MNNLIMEPSALKSCADTLINEAATQLSIYNDMKALIARLGSDWAGATYKEVLTRYEAQEKLLRNYTEMLKQFAKILKTTSDEFESMDSNLVRLFANY